MRIAAVIGASILGLLVGTTTLANAQHGREDGRESGSQKQHGNKHQEERGRSSVEHSDRHHANGPERREQHAHETHRANQDRSERQRAHDRSAHGPERMNEARWHEREQHSRPRDVWEDHRAQDWQREHHSWRERGGYRGYRIPEDRFVPTLAADIGFAFTAFPSSSWTDIPDFSTQASGSVWLIRGRNTGRVPGTRPTTFTSTTSVMAITCTTGAIPESLLPSTSRSNRQPEIP